MADIFGELDAPLNVSEFILAHEIHHAVGDLLANREHKPQEEKIKKYIQRASHHVGCFAAGLIVAGAGAIETMWQLAGYQVPEAGGGLIAGGLAVASVPTIAALKYKTLARDKFGIADYAPPYGEGELCANAYAYAMARKWQGVIEKSPPQGGSWHS
jgi:hypothetical protein